MAVEAQVRQVWAQPDVDGQMPQPLETVQSAAGRLMRQGDDNLVDRLDSGEAGQILERATNGAALHFRRDPAAAIVEQPSDHDPRVVLPDLLDEMCCLRSGADEEQARGQPAHAPAMGDDQSRGTVQRCEEGHGNQRPKQKEVERQVLHTAGQESEHNHHALKREPGADRTHDLCGKAAEVPGPVGVGRSEQIEAYQRRTGDGEPEQRLAPVRGCGQFPGEHRCSDDRSTVRQLQRRPYPGRGQTDSWTRRGS